MADSGRSELPPGVLKASRLFGLASGAFLVALILAAVSMRSEGVAAGLAPVQPVDVLAGKAIFDGEGCISCHSRMVRAVDRGMGVPASEEFMLAGGGYPGSARIGPDIQNLDRMYPESLLRIRLTEPETLGPGTVMPSYSHLGASKLNTLILYLQTSSEYPRDRWEIVRSINGIESAVPDQVLASLDGYIDPETQILVPPILDTEEFLITGSGVYKSRCAACHGPEGKGDGPISWNAGAASERYGSAVPLVPAADFTAPGFSDYSQAMIYWRITEGVPGTEMPAWGRTLSDDAIWYLVGYIRSLAEGPGLFGEVQVPPEQPLWSDLSVETGEEPGLLGEWELFSHEISASPDAIEENSGSADGASEEEGGSRNEGDASADATRSAAEGESP